MADPIRIAVVDDHELVREGLKAILEAEPDFSIVGEAGRGGQVEAMVGTARPDVVLLDARLPDVGGAEVCARLSRSHPEVRVVILTTYTDQELVQQCISSGARGYVVKDVERLWLKESIRAVHRGQSVLSPQVTGAVMDRFRSEARPTPPEPTMRRQQMAILRLVARGYSNREIALEMHLSENTVKSHVQAVFNKLGVRNRVEAAMLASRYHLV